MKNRKGFTIVELVIVIAVIAILAAVLIPTFSGVIAKANASNAQQTAMNAIKAGLLCITTAQLPDGTFVLVDTDKNITTNPDYGYVYSGNSLGDPVSLYGEDKAFKTSTYLTATDKVVNTVLVNSSLLVATEVSGESGTSYTVTMNDVLKNSIKVAFSSETDPSAAYDGEAFKITVGEVELKVGTSPDMPSNAFVFVKIG